MSGDVRVRAGSALAAIGLCLVAVAGCSSDPVDPVTTDPWVEGGLPAYCDGHGGEHAGFWELVHQSCEIADDGDVEQAVALRAVLEVLPEDEVAEFRRTFARFNKDLVPAMEVVDELCAPGLGLGEDLGTDYRSWVIAHGQDAYEAALADPERIRDFPDARVGCGRGEPFGAVAGDLLREG